MSLEIQERVGKHVSSCLKFIYPLLSLRDYALTRPYGHPLPPNEYCGRGIYVIQIFCSPRGGRYYVRSFISKLVLMTTSLIYLPLLRTGVTGYFYYKKARATKVALACMNIYFFILISHFVVLLNQTSCTSPAYRYLTV